MNDKVENQHQDPDIEKGTLRRHDLILAFMLWCVSLATLVESWRLTFHLNLPGVDASKAWLVAPGVFPLVLSASLLLMCSRVLMIALKEGKFKNHFGIDARLRFLKDHENIRQICQIILLCLYVFVLIGRVHFSVASTLYLFAAMSVAGAARWYIALIISIVFSATVTLLFGTAMKLPLP